MSFPSGMNSRPFVFLRCVKSCLRSPPPFPPGFNPVPRLSSAVPSNLSPLIRFPPLAPFLASRTTEHPPAVPPWCGAKRSHDRVLFPMPQVAQFSVVGREVSTSFPDLASPVRVLNAWWPRRVQAAVLQMRAGRNDLPLLWAWEAQYQKTKTINWPYVYFCSNFRMPPRPFIRPHFLGSSMFHRRGCVSSHATILRLEPACNAKTSATPCR